MPCRQPSVIVGCLLHDTLLSLSHWQAMRAIKRVENENEVVGGECAKEPAHALVSTRHLGSKPSIAASPFASASFLHSLPPLSFSHPTPTPMTERYPSTMSGLRLLCFDGGG